MTHGSLFSGIGGFDLAAEWMGWENKFHCEIDKYCQLVLKRLWPKSVLIENVKTADFRIYRGLIDVLSGGDPCQPHSVAGLGKGTADDRFLWPQMFRAAREIQPAWIVNENVTGSVSNGVLDLKIDDLESIGYACQPYNIPAEAVGALHQRERIWLVAYNSLFYADNRASRKIQSQGKSARVQKRYNIQLPSKPVDLRHDNSNAHIERFEEQHIAAESETFAEGLSRYFGFGANAHGNIRRDIIESGIIRMLDGLPEGLDYADRNKRIKALGNAIIPEVVYEIFKVIGQVNKTI